MSNDRVRDGDVPPGPAPDRRTPLFWRVAAVMAGAAVLWYVFLPLVREPFPDDSQVGFARWATALFVTATAVPMVWAARRYLDRRPWDGLRLTGAREGWWPFLVGALAWAIPGFAAIGVALAFGWVEIVPAVPATELVGSLALLVGLVLLYEALPEELIFRGYLFRNLNAAMAAWIAVAAQAALFGLWGTALWVLSNGWEVLGERAVLFFSMGIVLGCLRVVTGNVWTCIGFHLVFQVTAQAVLGGQLFEVRGGEEAFMPVLVAPFVFGVLVAILLWRHDGNWRARVLDPVG
ncbi:CPBP family intramembrane metalloprotease [Nocardiopsis sp. HNM0947]|uniref:CPBP family intramembrane metalloprotease n=1 Tax=Nocardiopsis coralli TaxID=2772213 RepID=A0ABR9PEN8_9ACTN|nr:CPBP family intramembrane glutamic endopeptidase [Nocardiopsis coralli]MBE3002281.1 CPBP family intramembrane metalloprotease [Nocardiopsis coralli]